MNFLRCFLAVACAASLQAGQVSVPNSQSPGGHWSLVFEESQADSFVLRARCSKTGKNTELMPGSLATDEDKLMLDCMAHAVQNVRSKKPDAGSYHVSWNRDATLLAIEAGAHKFGHFLLFRREGDRFSRIEVPVDFSGKLMSFVREKPPKIHQMGVNRFREKDPLFGEYPRVCLLEDACVAFSTYGAQCSKAFQDLPEEVQERLQSGPELYFLLRVRKAGPAEFVGFCQ